VKARKTIRKKRSEAGIALLISIFVLLLISVVAIALIVSSGTESALAGNYRSSTGVYYAALSGLEEARGRLLAKNPSSFKTTAGSFLPAPGTTLPIDSVAYVLNPGPTEAMGNILTTYPDTEYDNEFNPGALAAATVTTTASVWNRSPLNSLNIPGPLYKWVRINAVSEKSLNLDVDADTLADSITPLYYDGAHFSNSSSVGPQVFEITSFAALPNGSQKLLQYLVTASPISLPPFLAALTLSGSAGNAAAFHAPGTNASYSVNGNDQDCSGNPTGSKYPAVGVFNDTDRTTVINGIPSSPATVRQNYTGVNNPGPFVPDVERIDGTFPVSLQQPSPLDLIAQTIIQNADAVVPPGSAATQTTYLSSLGMSPSNPLTVVANGDLDVSNWGSTGYGLLLVTGTFTYDPDTTWNGVVLIIGKGAVVNSQNGQYKQINGAMLVAKTRDNSGILLPGPNLGGASMVFNDNMQGFGVRYSSCWIQKAQPVGSYKVLSFHEISQ
jgi:hypothetical protein